MPSDTRPGSPQRLSIDRKPSRESETASSAAWNKYACRKSRETRPWEVGPPVRTPASPAPPALVDRAHAGAVQDFGVFGGSPSGPPQGIGCIVEAGKEKQEGDESRARRVRAMGTPCLHVKAPLRVYMPLPKHLCARTTHKPNLNAPLIHTTNKHGRRIYIIAGASRHPKMAPARKQRSKRRMDKTASTGRTAVEQKRPQHLKF